MWRKSNIISGFGHGKTSSSSEMFTTGVLFLQDILRTSYFLVTHLSWFCETFGAFDTVFDNTATLHQQHKTSDVLTFLV